MTEHTPLPWARGKIDFKTNDGQVIIMAELGNDERKRVALVDCQSPYKRGQGYVSECAEREANADFIIAAVNERPTLLARIRELEDALTLILPLAKGYAAAHQVGSNAEYVAHAERVAALNARG